MQNEQRKSMFMRSERAADLVSKIQFQWPLDWVKLFDHWWTWPQQSILSFIIYHRRWISFVKNEILEKNLGLFAFIYWIESTPTFEMKREKKSQ